MNEQQLINYLSRLEELSLLETEEINREELTDELNEIYESAHDIFVDCEMNEYYTNNRMKCLAKRVMDEVQEVANQHDVLTDSFYPDEDEKEYYRGIMNPEGEDDE